MACHYPPDDLPTYEICKGDVFVRWCWIRRRYRIMEIISVFVTGWCRVRVDGQVATLSETDIRSEYKHAPRGKIRSCATTYPA